MAGARAPALFFGARPLALAQACPECSEGRAMACAISCVSSAAASSDGQRDNGRYGVPPRRDVRVPTADVAQPDVEDAERFPGSGSWQSGPPSTGPGVSQGEQQTRHLSE